MATDTKNFLFIFNKPPHGSPATKEGLDALLTASAFGQNITLLFIGDGVYQILKNQNPSLLPAKNTALIFEALELYGVENIKLLNASLLERGLTEKDLAIPCETLNNHQASELYALQHQIFSF